MIRTSAITSAALLLLLLIGAQGALTSQTQEATSANSLNLPAETPLLAKLVTNLDLQNCKPGDLVEALTTQDLKQGKEIALRKGSSLLGHVSVVEPATASHPEGNVGIVFDAVRTKKEPEQSLRLLVYALAPEAEGPTGSGITGGRGVPGATETATASGGASAGGLVGGQLTSSSVGVYGLPGLELSSRKTQAGEFTVMTYTKNGTNLKKGTQLLLKVIGH